MHQIEKIAALSYVDDCVYWYTSEAPGKKIVDTLGNRLHVEFLVFSHWFMSIRISHIKDHSIPVDQDKYANSVEDKYIDNVTFKKSTKFYNTTLKSNMIFTKDDVSTSY